MSLFKYCYYCERAHEWHNIFPHTVAYQAVPILFRDENVCLDFIIYLIFFLIYPLHTNQIVKTSSCVMKTSSCDLEAFARQTIVFEISWRNTAIKFEFNVLKAYLFVWSRFTEIAYMVNYTFRHTLFGHWAYTHWLALGMQTEHISFIIQLKWYNYLFDRGHALNVIGPRQLLPSCLIRFGSSAGLGFANQRNYHKINQCHLIGSKYKFIYLTRYRSL